MKHCAPFDLHVLSTPPAFILSQDQTLMFNLCQNRVASVLSGKTDIKSVSSFQYLFSAALPSAISRRLRVRSLRLSPHRYPFLELMAGLFFPIQYISVSYHSIQFSTLASCRSSLLYCFRSFSPPPKTANLILAYLLPPVNIYFYKKTENILQ